MNPRCWDSRSVPSGRLQAANDATVDPGAGYVLYWMAATRRGHWNFSLDRAVELARELRKPLLVVETLPGARRWASRRHHAFLIQGMADNARHFERAAVAYHPYVETEAGASLQFVAALADSACVVVADEFPIRSHVEDLATLAGRVRVRLERVDSNGLMPRGAMPRDYPNAHTFRRFLQKTLADHLFDTPKANPLAKVNLAPFAGLPGAIRRRWPAASARLMGGDWSALDALAIDQAVLPVEMAGGSGAARARLRAFVQHRLMQYDKDRNQPELDATSGLSPYLHAGHISVHEVFRAVAAHSAWSPDRLAEKATGKSTGWWGMPEAVESFLDELLTWRELGFAMCVYRSDYDRYESLPDWARRTLNVHARDLRDHVYGLDEFAQGRTHDPLWNAAQTQLVREGRMHNYLRMLWGKKILQWTASPQEALEVMIELNNRYALDGDDPSSYSGIFWVLGRYDRPWAPERPIFGRIRYMSSENTMRKVRVKGFIREYAPAETTRMPRP